MYHVALTPNEYPTNALSVKSPTLLGALSDLLNALDQTNESGDWIVPHVLEAAKEAIDNLENNEPAKGVWSDMGCEDDAFSIDIFCEDDARYVECDELFLLVPHGAVGLAIGQHNIERWIYDESEFPEWDNVLMPQTRAAAALSLVDTLRHHVTGAIERGEDAKITELIRDVKDGDCALSAVFDDGSTRKLFNFHIDELAFFDADLLGKIQEEANQLHHDRTVAYMGRPQLARIVDRELSTVNQEMLSLVRSAFDRFTDNDMQPPNSMLRKWLDSAQSVIAKATQVAESNAMRHITVYMSDGDTISTNINGADEEIMRQYLGNRFEAGSDTKHHVALAVHFHDTDKTYGLPIKAIEMGTTHRVKTVRRVTVCVDETKTIEEFMITTQGGAEFALDDVWVYNLNGEWIKGIGYKHATAETMYVANNSEHGYLVLDKDFGWRYTQDKTKATKNIKSEWDDIARQLTHRFKLIAI